MPELKIEISQNLKKTKIFPGPIGPQVRLLVGSAGPVTVVETTKPTKPCDNYFSNTIESSSPNLLKF